MEGPTRVLGTYVLITEVKEEIVTEMGLVLSKEDADKLRYKRGKVIKAGVDVNTLDAGDDIYYDSSAGFTMMIDGRPYTLIRERDISVVL